MSATNFQNKMAIPKDGSAFTARGTVEADYAGMVKAYVGIIQVVPTTDGTQGLVITGAAYGMGTPNFGADPKVPGDTDRDDDGNQRWFMDLIPDYEHPLHAGSAVGFLQGEMPGGRVTGWIEANLELTGGPESPVTIAGDDERVLKAILSPEQWDQVKKVRALLPKNGK